VRLGNVGVEKGDEVRVFMLGKGALFEKSGNEHYDVMGQMEKFGGDFYVRGVCMKSHGLEGLSGCPIFSVFAYLDNRPVPQDM
jgi:hypothetical protein